MGLNDRCWAGMPAVSPGPHSWLQAHPHGRQAPSAPALVLSEGATPGVPGGGSQLLSRSLWLRVPPSEGPGGTVGCPGRMPG